MEKEVNIPAKSSRRPQVSEKCIGCGACIAICPDVFDFTSDGLAKPLRLDSYEGKGVENAISACPTGAIKWLQI